MKRALPALIALALILACAGAAWAYVLWTRNTGVIVDIDPVLFAPLSEVPVIPLLAAALLVGLIAGGAIGAWGAGVWGARLVLAARRALADNQSLRAELHAWRTLSLEEPSFLSADSQGRVSRREPPREAAPTAPSPGATPTAAPASPGGGRA